MWSDSTEGDLAPIRVPGHPADILCLALCPVKENRASTAAGAGGSTSGGGNGVESAVGEGGGNPGKPPRGCLIASGDAAGNVKLWTTAGAPL